MKKITFPIEIKEQIKKEIISELENRKLRLDSDSIDFILGKAKDLIEANKQRFDNQEIISSILKQAQLSEQEKQLSFNKEKIWTKEVRTDFIEDIVKILPTPKDGINGTDGEKGESGQDGNDYTLTDVDKLDIAQKVELTGLMKEDVFNLRTAQLIKDLKTGKIQLPGHGGVGGSEVIAKIDKTLGSDIWKNGVPDTGFKWTSLLDTPSAYTGNAGNIPVVKSTTDGLEFLDISTDWLSQYLLLSGRSDQKVTGPLKIGGETDYLEIEADGTDVRKGNSTQWDDIVRSLAAQKLESSAGKVDYDWGENAIVFNSGGNIATRADRLIFSMEAPHAMLTDSSMHVHIHWEQTTTNNIQWTLQYRIQKNGAAKITTWTTVTSDNTDNVFTYMAGTLNQITELAMIDLTDAGISATVQIRLARTDATAGNILGTFVDAHIERDMIGSRSEYVK